MDARGAPIRFSLPRQILAARDDLLYQAVRNRLGGVHPVVAVGIARNALDALPRRLGDDLVQSDLRLLELSRMDLDVGGDPLDAGQGLVDEVR